MRSEQNVEIVSTLVMCTHVQVVESCCVHLRKPDAAIYKYTLDQLQCKPDEAIFLDDLGMNLKGASQVGIRTIKVCSEGNLKQREMFSDV